MARISDSAGRPGFVAASPMEVPIAAGANLLGSTVGFIERKKKAIGFALLISAAVGGTLVATVKDTSRHVGEAAEPLVKAGVDLTKLIPTPCLADVCTSDTSLSSSSEGATQSTYPTITAPGNPELTARPSDSPTGNFVWSPVVKSVVIVASPGVPSTPNQVVDACAGQDLPSVADADIFSGVIVPRNPALVPTGVAADAVLHPGETWNC